MDSSEGYLLIPSKSRISYLDGDEIEPSGGRMVVSILIVNKPILRSTGPSLAQHCWQESPCLVSTTVSQLEPLKGSRVLEFAKRPKATPGMVFPQNPVPQLGVPSSYSLTKVR